jgi:hypothetical protein
MKEPGIVLALDYLLSSFVMTLLYPEVADVKKVDFNGLSGCLYYIFI